MKRILSALLLGLIAAQAWAISGTVVKQDQVQTSSDFSTETADLGSNPTVGNLLVLVQSANDASLTVSCPSGFTAGPLYAGASNSSYGVCWKKSVGTEQTVTPRWVEANTTTGSYVYAEFSGEGLDLSAVHSGEDESNVATNVTTQGSGSAANVTTTGLAVAFIGVDNVAGTNGLSGWTNSYVEQSDIGFTSRTYSAIATKVLSSAASTSTDATIASSQQAYGAILVFDASTCPATCAGGRTGVCITDTASNTDPDNILYGQSPAVVANEDTICHDATSTLSAAVTVSAAGWVELASGGSILTDEFDYCIMDNGAACGTDGTFQITQTPVLSNPVGAETGQTTAALSVDVAQVEGTVYACVSEDSGTPSHAQIAAGNDALGAACTFAASDATPSASQAFSATGLTADTVYYASFGQPNAATAPLTATVVKSAAFQTEAAGDTTPDAFSFADVTGAVGGYEYVSSAIEIAGTTAATNVVITISGCEYAIDSGSGYGSYTSAAGVVQLGYGVRLRNTASLEALDTANCTPTIGGVSDTWYVTTRNETLVDFVNRLVRQLVQPLVDQGVK